MRLNYLLYILPYLFYMAAYADYSKACKEFIKDIQTVDEKGQKEAADFINTLNKSPKQNSGDLNLLTINKQNQTNFDFVRVSDHEKTLTSNNILRKGIHGQSCNKCQIEDSKFNFNTSIKDAILPKTEFLVFVSLSLGKATLKKLYQEVHKVGGRLILRGLYKDSLLLTQQKIKALRIGVDIDPPLFERFSIQEVPTFILTEPHQEEKSFNYDILKGNVTLQFALEKFVAEGEIKEAQLLLEKLNGAPHA